MKASNLPTLIRECVDVGARPITSAEIRARAAAGRHAPVRHVATRSRVLPVALAGGLSAALAVGVTTAVVSAHGGDTKPGTTSVAGSKPSASDRGVLDAVTLRHIQSTSRAAMATSGRARISFRTTGAPGFEGSGTQDIAFDGANWNDSFSEKLPSGQGQSAINRVVNGQAYDFFPVHSSTPQWVHDAGKDAVQALNIPDPRTLLGVLSPRAGLVAAGYTTVDGVRVEKLHATTPGNIPASLLGRLGAYGAPASTAGALDLLIDSSGVVRQVTFTLVGTDQSWTLTPAGQREFAREIAQRQVDKTEITRLMLSPAWLKACGPLSGTSPSGWT